MTQPYLESRSRDVTDGLERAAACGVLRAVSVHDDDFASHRSVLPPHGMRSLPATCRRTGSPTPARRECTRRLASRWSSAQSRFPIEDRGDFGDVVFGVIELLGWTC
jgi:hypothetical protein